MKQIIQIQMLSICQALNQGQATTTSEFTHMTTLYLCKQYETLQYKISFLVLIYYTGKIPSFVITDKHL